MRVQVRSDGFSIDQIVVSPQSYLTAAPGARVSDTAILAAHLPALIATVSVSPSPSSGFAPLGVNFSAQVSGATASTYNWNFGDGQTSTDAVPSHIYQTAGNYSAHVTITDSSGGNASASGLVAVAPSSSPGTTFRAVQANISYGGHGTDNILNLDRTADYLVKLNPDAAGLTEAIGGYNDPALITAIATTYRSLQVALKE
jgi:PKD repeat protein